MKRIFTTLFAVLGICTLTKAQTKNQNEFGISAGYGLAYVTDNSTYGTGTGQIGGASFAVSAEHYLSESWGIKLKGIYDPKGWGNSIYTTANGSGSKTVTGVNFRLNYITVPITLNYHFGREHEWYVNAGPYVGFLTKADEDYDYTNFKSNFNSTDFGADLGLGIKFPISDKLKIFLEYDGQFGFSNIFANDAISSQNSRSSLSVGLKF
jgi:opacity protein-like surface antigen